jgi:hypothetical protein
MSKLSKLGGLHGHAVHVISFQQWVSKTENSLISRLVARLNELKLDYDLNAEQIYNVESELLEIIDKDIMEKLKIFECLNAEKPTPLFMSLARCRSTAKKLSAINKDNGSPYNTDNDTNEGIISFYENLCKKPADERLNYDNCTYRRLLRGG